MSLGFAHKTCQVGVFDPKRDLCLITDTCALAAALGPKNYPRTVM